MTSSILWTMNWSLRNMSLRFLCCVST